MVPLVGRSKDDTQAAGIWSGTGAIPAWAEIYRRTAGIAIGAFMASGIVGSIALAWHMRESRGLSSELVASGGIVLVVALVFAALSIPAAAMLLAGWVSVAWLVQSARGWPD